MKTCTENGCERQPLARGKCVMHYWRDRKHLRQRGLGNILVPDGKKTCAGCGEEKKLSEFARYAAHSRGFRKKCRSCCALECKDWRRKNEKSVRSAWLKRNYGITLEEYESLLRQQEGKCAICSIPEESTPKCFAVDHDHSTGDVRGLLCMSCNVGIGNFRDNPAFLASAIQYLSPSKREE